VGKASRAKHEILPVPKINTPKGTTNYLYNSRAIVQAVMHQNVTAAAQVQSQANACSICRRKTGSGTSFPASSSVLPYSFIQFADSIWYQQTAASENITPN